MKVTNNYSALKTREKRLYSISGTTISQTGWSYLFIQVAGSLLVLFNIVGATVCFIGGKFYYWPIKSDMSINPAFLVFFVGGPFALTLLLLYTKVQNYSLLQFLSAYLRPKRTRDEQGKVIKYSKYEQDSFIERVL